MTLRVEKGDPRHPEATALLQDSHALMEALFPPEDNHYLSIDALCTPDIHFFVARDGDRIIGTAALADKGRYGEMKSMFVAETARGKGAADALIEALETQARALSHSSIKLETGNLLTAAHRLYARHGFQTCDRFGDYPENDTSLFMSKDL